MDRIFTKVAGEIAAFAGQPITFIISLALIIGWAVTGPLFHYSDTWQLVINTSTTIITFLMVFLIQNSQNRDAGAMQAKLDELIRAVDNARGQFIGIEHLTDRQIQEIRTALEADCANEPDRPQGKTAKVTTSVERLLERY
jgi:low affinity Fe/Cu permease